MLVFSKLHPRITTSNCIVHSRKLENSNILIQLVPKMNDSSKDSRDDKKRNKRSKRGDRRGVEESTKFSNDNYGSEKFGIQQVQESLVHLDQRKYTGIAEVTAIRVETDEIESKRRIEDDDLRRERLGKLQHEALASAKANAAVEMKWAEILEKEIPQELDEEIQKQMKACNSIIKNKDELILEFQRQLRSKDEEYVRTLRKQAEDIEELLCRIRREFKEMQHEYEKEFALIENAYKEERESIKKKHSDEIEKLFEKRLLNETEYLKNKKEKEEEYQNRIDELITNGADQYNKLKVELELNIQTLKQQLEEIKSTYQLNNVKLRYNYRVLQELDTEKTAELTRYKRRTTKLKDQLNQLYAKHAEMEKWDTKSNADLSEDYRTLTQKYKDLQAKFRHFEVSDTNKYEEVWAMHEDEAKDLVDHLLKADQIITQQLLGWRWQSPDMHALQAVLGRHGAGIGGVQTVAGMGERQAGDADDGSPNHTGNSGGGVVANGSTVEFAPSSLEGMKKVAGTRIRAMLRLLASEAGFLTNVESLIADLPDDEAELAQAEMILKSLGVKSEEKLNNLVQYFFKDNGVGFSVSKDNVMISDDNADELLLLNPPEDVAELKDMIRAEDVIAAIKSFMEDSMAEGPLGAPAVANARAREEEERIRQKRLNTIRNYWTQLAQVVSDEHVDLWRQLERDCTNLKKMLSRRTAMITEVDEMSRKNVELKRLLNNYLGDVDMNTALQIPPAQVMKVRQTGTIKTKSKVQL